MRAALLLTATALVLSACASPSGGEAGRDAAPRSDAGASAGLVVEIDRGDGSPAERYTLTCGDLVEGDHPDGAAACAHLAGLEDPFAPLADDAICTEQFGGPQTARVTGVWAGEPVDLELSRENGCAIAQWDGLGPLLGGPAGVSPPS